MPAELVVLLFVAFAIAAIVLGYLGYQAEQQRKAALQALASQHGWQFDSAHDHSHDERFGHFSAFSRGKSRYAYNTLRGPVQIGDRQWPLQLGDYHYQTTSHDGKRTHTHTHRLSYLLVELPYVTTPELIIRKENFFDRIAEFIGFDDIDFESAEFSRQFIVKSPDKRFAYDVIHPQMMEFLLHSDPPALEAARGYACLTRGERCWTIDDFQATLRWAAEFFEHWPRHLVAQLNGPAS